MQVTRKWDSSNSTGPSTKPVMAALLVTGAGVAAVVHPPAVFRAAAVPESHDTPGVALAAELRVGPAVTLTAPTPVLPRPVRMAEARPAAPVGPPPGIRSQARPLAAAGLSQEFVRSSLADKAPTVVIESPAAHGDDPAPALVASIADSALEAPLIGGGDQLTAEPEAEAQALAPSRVSEPEEVSLAATPVAPPSAKLALATADAAPGSDSLLARPVPETPPVRLQMPSAELKAMMVAEVASRGGMAAPRNELAPGPERRDPAPAATRYASMSSMSSMPSLAVATETVEPVAAPDDQIDVTEETDRPGASTAAMPEPLPEQHAFSRYSQTERGIEFAIAAQVNGSPAGTVPLLIADSENISVRLGDILALIEPAMEKSVFAALSPSPGASEYVTFNTLRAHGIAIRFDAHDQLILGLP